MKVKDLTTLQYIEIKRKITKYIVELFPEMPIQEICILLGAFQIDLSTIYYRHLHKIHETEKEKLEQETERWKGGIILHFLDQEDEPKEKRQEILFRKFN